jgi:hypothetical protein
VSPETGLPGYGSHGVLALTAAPMRGSASRHPFTPAGDLPGASPLTAGNGTGADVGGRRVPGEGGTADHK